MLSQPPGEAKDSVLIPTREGKDSACTDPTRGGKDSACTKCIYPRKTTPSRGQIKSVRFTVGEKKCSQVHYSDNIRRLQTTLQRKASPNTVSFREQWIRRSKQTKCLVECYSRLALQKGHRSSAYSKQSRFLQSTLPRAKTRQSLETSYRPQCLKQVLGSTQVQNGNTRVNSSFSQKGRMDYINRLNGCIPTHTYPSSISQIPQIPLKRNNLPVQKSTIRPSNGSFSVYKCSERSKTHGPTTTHSHPPVSGRLVNKSTYQREVPLTNPAPTSVGTGTGTTSKCEEVRTVSQPKIRLPRIPLFTRFGSCEAHSRQMDKTSGCVPPPLKEVCHQCKDSYVHHWLISSNGEDSKAGQDSYETFSVASQSSLEISNASELSSPLGSENDTTRGVVVGPQKRATRRISPPKGTRSTHIYRRLKRRLGRSLRSTIYKRGLVSQRKRPSHQPVRTKGSVSGSTVFPKELQQKSSPHCLRQHLGGVLHQQTGRNQISGTLCSNVENHGLVQQTHGYTQSKTCTRTPERHSRRTLQEESNSIHGVVPVSTDLQQNFQIVGKSPSGLICNQPEHKTPFLCLSDSGSSGLGSGRPQHPMGRPGCIRLPTNRPPAPGCTKTPITNVQDDSDRPRLANEIMVLGPSGTVTGYTTTSTSNPISAKAANERDIPPQPSLHESPRLVSRSTSLQQDGFNAEVADRIAAPQRLSTRTIYTSKWTVFQRWCTEQQVDFRHPTISDICNFFWHLFHDLNRCPSTIEGYRTAIADTLGNTTLNISNNPDIARLITSFHRDRPKAARPLPKWDLALVLHMLTQPPFEPLEEASQKHLTWKTIFLLALASGKRRSEIHAWTLEGLLCLGEWDQVQLSPSPSFIAKNQLAKEGPQSVAPVLIPTLHSNQDTEDKDILLCPVRALKTYVERTAESRKDRKLLFVSYKQGFSKDIQCSTISSWIKNTIKVCYSKAQHTDMDLTGIKAHDVRAFAASKAFFGGVSIDQIMQACHWKSHNTFTKFYLKDLAGKDKKKDPFILAPS